MEASRHFREYTIFLLIARDHSKLVKVKEEMHKLEPENKGYVANKIITLKLDFSQSMKAAELVNILQITLKDEKLDKINELFVFYNHGTLQL